jgi:hypothetical protein
MSSLLGFKRVYRLELQSFMLVDPTLVTISPLILSFVHPPPPPSQSQSTEMYKQCVAGTRTFGLGGDGGGGGGFFCYIGDQNMQEFNTLYLTRIRTYKIALPPQTINLVGEGASDI